MAEEVQINEHALGNEDYYREVGYYQEEYSSKPKDPPTGAQIMYFETVQIEKETISRRLIFDPKRWRGLPIKIETIGTTAGKKDADSQLAESRAMLEGVLGNARNWKTFNISDPSRLFVLVPNPQD